MDGEDGGSLNDVDRALLNAFQTGFPVVHRPFEPAAQALRSQGVSTSAADLVARVDRLAEAGVLAAFGAPVDPDAVGGETTVVAASVDADRVDEVAKRVAGIAGVVECSERDHPDLNLWVDVCVPADPERDADAATRVDDALAAVESATGTELYEFPTQRSFCADEPYPVSGPVREGDVDLSHLGPNPDPLDRDRLTADEHALVREIQDGFPVSLTPYEAVADTLDQDLEWVLETIRRFNVEDRVRRVGVVPNPAALGYTEHAVTVWDVPDSAVEDVGEALSDRAFVSHCVERPRREDVWPYNVFARTYARHEDELEARTAGLRDVVREYCEVADGDWATLSSTRRLGKADRPVGVRGAVSPD